MSISGVSPGTSALLSNLLSGSSSSSNSSSSSGSTSSSSSSNASSNVKLSALQQFDLQEIQGAQASVTAYQQFSATLTGAHNALIGVLASSFSTALSGVTSSNGNVAYIAPSAGTNYAVDVSQLADDQQIKTGLTTTNTTTTPGFTASGTQVFNTGSLTLQIGKVDTSAGKFTGIGKAVTVNVTDGSLQGVASAINSSQLGISAKIVTDNSGNAQLQVTGPDSGANSGFTISGTDTGASGQSLSTLDFGTNAATNTANYAGSVQGAQDAQYTVNGQQFSSPTNLNVPVAPGINLNLLTTGSTVVSQPQAPSQTISAANSLVSTLNGVFQVLQQFTGNGGPLANDPSTVFQFQNDVSLAANSPYGSGNITLLSQIGISQQAGGQYQVDTTTLANAYAQNPDAVQNVLSQVSSALLQVTSSYTGQFGQVTQRISFFQSQVQIFTGQFQADQNSQTTSNAQATAAVQAYNLLAGATGGSLSPFTSQVA